MLYNSNICIYHPFSWFNLASGRCCECSSHSSLWHHHIKEINCKLLNINQITKHTELRRNMRHDPYAIPHHSSVRGSISSDGWFGYREKTPPTPQQLIKLISSQIRSPMRKAILNTCLQAILSWLNFSSHVNFTRQLCHCCRLKTVSLISIQTLQKVMPFKSYKMVLTTCMTGLQMAF
jgi:hypothetical protein